MVKKLNKIKLSKEDQGLLFLGKNNLRLLFRFRGMLLYL